MGSSPPPHPTTIVYLVSERAGDRSRARRRAASVLRWRTISPKHNAGSFCRPPPPLSACTRTPFPVRVLAAACSSSSSSSSPLLACPALRYMPHTPHPFLRCSVLCTARPSRAHARACAAQHIPDAPPVFFVARALFPQARAPLDTRSRRELTHLSPRRGERALLTRGAPVCSRVLCLPSRTTPRRKYHRGVPSRLFLPSSPFLVASRSATHVPLGGHVSIRKRRTRGERRRSARA